MFKRFLQCISTLLVLVLLVNILPMQALADMQLDATDNVSPVTKENVVQDRGRFSVLMKTK